MHYELLIRNADDTLMTCAVAAGFVNCLSKHTTPSLTEIKAVVEIRLTKL